MLRQSQKGAKASTPDSLQETSEVEKEAIVAVEATTGIVLFLADPTGSCGWPLPEQMRLFEMLKTNYPDRKFVVVENKADLMRVESPYLKISCVTGEGLSELVGAVETALGGSPRHRPWSAPDKSQDPRSRSSSDA
jgi:nucleolar GTP-binding protein